MTEEEKAAADDRNRRAAEDFEFLVLCNMKGNMGLYNLLRDRSLDEHKPKNDEQDGWTRARQVATNPEPK